MDGSPGGVKYRAPYGANNRNVNDDDEDKICDDSQSAYLVG